MSGNEDQDPRFSRDQLMQEASIWFARMRGPDAEEHRKAFDAWLARGALHRRAYNRAAEIFAMGKVLVDDGPADQASQDPGPSLHPGKLFVALFAAAALGLAAWAALGGTISTLIAPDTPSGPSNQIRSQASRYVTLASETRTIRLSDGSSVAIGPNSSLLVNFSDSRRLLRLESGQARFDVAHERRPFVVAAGGGTVTARGTIFDVAIGAGRQVTVRLIRGSVDVAFPAGGAQAPAVARTLAPGESLSFSTDTPSGFATPSSASPATSPPPAENPGIWRNYDDARVADIVAEANRNARVHIRLTAPAVGDQRISGHFRLDDTARLADRLAVLFELTIDRSDPEEIVLRSR